MHSVPDSITNRSIRRSLISLHSRLPLYAQKHTDRLPFVYNITFAHFTFTLAKRIFWQRNVSHSWAQTNAQSVSDSVPIECYVCLQFPWKRLFVCENILTGGLFAALFALLLFHFGRLCQFTGMFSTFGWTFPDGSTMWLLLVEIGRCQSAIFCRQAFLALCNAMPLKNDCVCPIECKNSRRKNPQSKQSCR